MVAQFKYSDEVRAEAARLRGEGLSCVEAGRMLGIPPGAVSDLTRPPRRPAEERSQTERNAKIREMAAAGNHTNLEIGRIFGIAGTTVGRIVGIRKPRSYSTELEAAVIADLLDDKLTHSQIAAKHGLKKHTVRAIWAGIGSGEIRKRPSTIPAELVERVIEMRSRFMSQKDIAKACGVAAKTVVKILAQAAERGVAVQTGRISSPVDRDELRQAKNARRREARAKSEAPTTKPKAASRALGPIRFVAPPPINRAAERAAIDAAIAAGIGKRFEFIRGGKASQADKIRTGADAAAHLEALGFTVDKRISRAYTRYQVSGGSTLDALGWMRPQQFVHAVKALLVGSTYRAVPLREKYASQQMGA